MSEFEFPQSIKSRPVYGRFEIRLGRTHLMIAGSEGAEAIILLARKDKTLMAATQIVFIPGHTGDEFISELELLNSAQLYIGPSYEAAVPRIRHVLRTATMGLQVYLSGTEGFIGQAQNEAMQAGIPHSAIQTEHRGSVARRMQCVHCKGITEDVIVDPFVCSHCGLHLFVRDHYSRRIAAFQGVCVDAETPGLVPESRELYK